MAFFCYLTRNKQLKWSRRNLEMSDNKDKSSETNIRSNIHSTLVFMGLVLRASRVKSFFVPSENINTNTKCLEDRFLKFSTVKGTRLKHYFIPTENGKREISRVSLAKRPTGTK